MQISKGLGGRLMNPIGRLRDQSSEGCSQSVKKLALEVGNEGSLPPSISCFSHALLILTVIFYVELCR